MSKSIIKPSWSDIIRTGLEILAAMPIPAECFEMACSCAVYDQPYLLRYGVRGSGPYRFLESTKVKYASRPGRERSVDTQSSLTLDLNRLGGHYPCAWCGATSFGYCHACDAYVCYGRLQRKLFRCRPSCGAQWVGEPIDTISGGNRRLIPESNASSQYLPAQSRKPQSPRLADGKAARQLALPERLRLLGGK